MKHPFGEDVVAMITPFVINLSAERDQWDYEESQTEHVVIDLAAEEFASRCYAPAEAVEKKAVTDEKAKQFLATIKNSEFDVIEQLRKIPAQISLLELFKTSEKHKNAPLRVLNEVHVPEDIGDKQLEEFVGSILLVDQISFSEEDLPKEGTNHNKALLISAKCHDMIVPRILLDNGSALNICPLATLHRLGVSEEEITASQSTIRAFDGVRKQSMGEIELELLIGLALFTLKFQVLDIPSAFNLLLGRPWIHGAVAVPSTLHQMVRFISKKKLVTVRCETNFKVFQDTAIPYVEPEVNEESSYQTLDLVSMVHVPTGSIMRRPEFSASFIMSSKVLLEYGHVPGAGLGMYAQL
ncbi:hypothetical protein BT93_I0127 [Corymbia citriodora subsp. variegata]|nr:hypothetical protein BT93_I0127 [Corymbia citriodora subsp. variegata]